MTDIHQIFIMTDMHHEVFHKKNKKSILQVNFYPLSWRDEIENLVKCRMMSDPLSASVIIDIHRSLELNYKKSIETLVFIIPKEDL